MSLATRLRPTRTSSQAQLGVDGWGAVGATAAGMELADLADQCLVSQGPGDAGREAQAESPARATPSTRASRETPWWAFSTSISRSQRTGDRSP
jgi:hypothetical protein